MREHNKEPQPTPPEAIKKINENADDWKVRFICAFREAYKGILSEETISQSITWHLNFMEPYINTPSERGEGLDRERLCQIIEDNTTFKRCGDTYGTVNELADAIIKHLGEQQPKENT